MEELPIQYYKTNINTRISKNQQKYNTLRLSIENTYTF